MMELVFNPAPATVMHIDINSCFATVEQQANPLLRGKPVAVAAYTTPNGCILAASVEAKRFGVKTGMHVGEGKRLCPKLIILPPDPNKYRHVNRRLFAILSSYTAYVSVESIDEMVMSFAHTPVLIQRMGRGMSVVEAMRDIACEIKQRIRQEIGIWITVSAGIAPNRYLAKIASGLIKPDGLRDITRENIADVFASMQLEDFCGIKTGNANRLRCTGITTPLQMLFADERMLVRAFHAVGGRHWWLRLHGWEDGSLYKDFDSTEEDQKTFGQSHALAKPRLPQDPALHQILSQLVVKMARRMRCDGYTARGIGISCLFADYTHWRLGHMYKDSWYADGDMYREAKKLLLQAPIRGVRILAVFSYHLAPDLYQQESLLPQENKKRQLTRALDGIADRWGDFVVTPARMLSMEQKVLDRIAFGGGRGLRKAANS